MINKIVRSAAGPYLLLIVTALGTLLFRLGALPFIGADECRYARIAEEMNQTGRWVTPVLQGYPWLEKPPLYYWITIPWYRIFGAGEFSARLGPALCALIACATILWFGSKLWSRRAGSISGMILLTTLGFSAYGRSASPDMPVTATFTIAMALLAAAVLRGGLPFWQIGCAYALLGFAVLAKGPVALMLAAGIMILFWALDEKGGSLKKLCILRGSVITLAVALPWHWLAFKENGFAFITTYFINHNFARYVTDVHHHAQPLYYFLLIMLGLFFPWTGWIPALHPGSLRRVFDFRTWDRTALFLGCWTLFPILFFSLSSSKLPGYVLPSVPPLALLLGNRLASWSQNPSVPSRSGFARWCHLIFSLGTAVAFPIIMQTNYGNAWRPGLVLAAAVLVPALFAFVLARRGHFGGAIRATMFQGLILVVAATQFGFPFLAAYHSARDIANQALAAEKSGEPIVTYCFFHHALLYYTGYRIEANITDAASLIDYARKRPSCLVVTDTPTAENLSRMPEISVAPLGRQGDLRLLRIFAVHS